ncbi:MAG TPA: MFS transporter [Anaerolineae bacterium]|nr:MFS transporter [Anaerolineae bacterium]
MKTTSTVEAATKGAGLVLLVLASGQFLMTLDSSVMNVSIATVAKDVGTTVTGIQTAITLYTLVMASLMITGGKIGAIIGRRRAFGIGLVIYGAGSFTTAIAPNLTVLIIGWSFLEGIGAALIMPAIVALVAGNFPPTKRSAAYGMIAAAGAMAVAAGPLIGGAFTTFWSWRWVFLGEDVIVVLILLTMRKIQDVPPGERPHIDFVGALLSIVGLSMAVLGVLKSAEWGWLQPKTDAPTLFGASLVVWLILGGLFVLWLFMEWEERMERQGKEPLLRMELLGNRQLSGGLMMFFFQFMVQAGTFFVIPLFLSVVLGLSALATGVRLLPLSFSLLIFAIAIPKFWPQANPRRVVRIGLLALFGGALMLAAGIDPEADATITTIPMLLMGCGIGALASQLGAVTVSAVPDERSAEVGGVQNTATNLGASLGTALVGSILIATLTASFITGIQNNPTVPDQVKAQASTELASGIPFISDADLQAALTNAGVPPDLTAQIVQENSEARLVALRASMSIVALFTVVALFLSTRIPTKAVGTA